jgi:hypothetical protein
MLRKLPYALFLVLFLAGGVNEASAACNPRYCNPPYGYIEQCFAQCGSPGTCTSSQNALDYCLLTFDLYGCHDGTDDPCCCTDPGF